MVPFLESIFSLFGKKPISQLVGSAVVGSYCCLWYTFYGAPFESQTWLILGAIAGATAGVSLLIGRIMYGVFFVLMGLFLIVAPKSKGSEKIPLTFEELLVIIGIGAVLILIGALLIRSHFKKRKK
jgi:hypothetical protein